MAVLIFCLLCALSFAGAALLERRFEQTLPLSFFALILVLYVCGLCGSVRAGVYLVWAMGAAALVFAAREARLGKVSVFGQLITPGFAAFAVVFFGFWIVHTGRRPFVWDDFSHWATVVKNMFYVGGFGNGAGANTVFREYPPAMALLEFFFAQSGGAFREDMLYRAFSIFLCAVQLPVFRHIGWKRAWMALLLLPIVVVLPMIFFEEAYISIYADPVLGLLFAYIVLSWLDGESAPADWIAIGMAAAVLTLTKTAGFGVALIALLILALQKRSWRQRSWWMALPAAAVLLAFGSWQIYFKSLRVPGVFMLGGMTPEGLLALIQRRAPAYQYDTIRNFLRAVIHDRLYGKTIRASFAQVIQLFFALILPCVALRPKGRRAEMGWTFFCLMAGCVAYAGMLLSVYVFVFGEGEGTGLASMSRYMGSYFLGVFAILAYVSVRDALTARGWWWRGALCAALAFAIMHPYVSWMAFKRSTYEAQIQIDYTQDALRPFEEVQRRAKAQDEAARVWCWGQGLTGYELYQANYAFTPEEIEWVPEDVWELKDPAAALAEALRGGGATHLYLYRAGDLAAFAGRFSSLFSDPASIVDGGLFRVVTLAGSLQLETVP